MKIENLKISTPVFLIGAAVVMSAGGAAYASCASQNCTDVRVIRILKEPALSYYVIRTSGAEADLGVCSGASGNIEVRTPEADDQALFSLLLTAHERERPLNIRVKDTPGQPCQLRSAQSDIGVED